MSTNFVNVTIAAIDWLTQKKPFSCNLKVRNIKYGQIYFHIVVTANTFG